MDPLNVALEWQPEQVDVLLQALELLGPQLTVLAFSACQNCFPASVSSAVAQYGTRLRVLRLPDCAWAAEGLAMLGANATALQVFEAGGISISVRAPLPAEALGHLAGCTQLQELHLDATQLKDAQLIAIALGCGPSLRVLDLAGCACLTDAAIAVVAEMCPQLETLNLRMCAWVAAAGVTALGQHCHELRVLDLDRVRGATGGLQALVGCPKLEVLTVSQCTLLAEDLQAICTGLPSLSRLDLNAARLPSLPAYELLAHCTSLHHLSLNGHKLPDGRLDDVCELLARSLPNLESLDLNNSSLKQRGLDAVRAALPNCHVHTIHCNLGD